VLIMRSRDYFVPISQRAHLANVWDADIFLSIHCNADPNEDKPGMREAKGSEVWIYPGSVKGRRVAESLEKAVRAFFPDRNFRGIKEEELGVLRLTRMPAALLEVAFIDTQESHRLADPQVQRAIAEAISSALNF
jgi:N-acetylmuramoyl-L-alanine amidase